MAYDNKKKKIIRRITLYKMFKWMWKKGEQKLKKTNARKGVSISMRCEHKIWLWLCWKKNRRACGALTDTVELSLLVRGKNAWDVFIYYIYIKKLRAPQLHPLTAPVKGELFYNTNNNNRPWSFFSFHIFKRKFSIVFIYLMLLLLLDYAIDSVHALCPK